MNRDELELAKLQAELDKLQTEEKEISLRNEMRPANLRSEKWKLVPAYLGVFATLAIVTIQSFQYLDQRKKEQKFQFDAQIIELVTVLVDPSDERLQRTAALQLAYLGRPASTLLIESIDFNPTDSMVDTISRALVDVARNTDYVDEIISLLEDSAGHVARRELAKKTPIWPNIRRQLSALNYVTSRLLIDSEEQQYSTIRMRVNETLEKIVKEISKSKDQSDGMDSILSVLESGKTTLAELEQSAQDYSIEGPWK